MAEAIDNVITPPGPVIPVTDPLGQYVDESISSIASNLNNAASDPSNSLDILFHVPDIDLLSSIQPLYPLTQENIGDASDLGGSSTEYKEKSEEVLEVYQKTLGRFNPEWRHYRATEERYLSLAFLSPWTDEQLSSFESYEGHDKLPPSVRDQILVMVIDICEPENVSSIISAFPSADVLDRLVQSFLMNHAQEENTWIHLPTFRASETWTGLLAACIAAGAVKAPCDNVRRFGLAIHDILHLYLFKSVSSEKIPYAIYPLT